MDIRGSPQGFHSASTGAGGALGTGRSRREGGRDVPTGSKWEGSALSPNRPDTDTPRQCGKSTSHRLERDRTEPAGVSRTEARLVLPDP